MSGFGLISAFSRLAMVSPLQQSIRTITTSNPFMFRATQCLWAEPLKRKKKMDPMIIRQREERKKKKLMKNIRRLQKNARQLKPIDENDVPFVLIDQKQKRTRPNVVLETKQVEYRALLSKEWCRYKLRESLANARNLNRIVTSQKRALEALREESEELYEEAIAIDMCLVPYNGRGPVATPPMKDFESPDGEYVDVSKKWKV